MFMIFLSFLQLMTNDKAQVHNEKHASDFVPGIIVLLLILIKIEDK